jgi:hypothetical protein
VLATTQWRNPYSPSSRPESPNRGRADPWILDAFGLEVAITLAQLGLHPRIGPTQ